MPFGQIIIGSPASGKSTYCLRMAQLMNEMHDNYQKSLQSADSKAKESKYRRGRCYIVNLDPANDQLPYEAGINIFDFITQHSVMTEQQIGPNAALIYCMERLVDEFEWLERRIDEIISKDPYAYFIFDCPGQVELFTCNYALKRIIDRLSTPRPPLIEGLESAVEFRLCSVHLVDASHCTDPARYISVVLLCLQTMLYLELPHVNILSKIDLVEAYDTLAFDLSYYTEVQNLSFLLQHLNADSATKKYGKLNEELCNLIEEFGLVNFYTFCADDNETAYTVMRVIDKANGFIFGGLDEGNEAIMEVAARVGQGFLEDVQTIEERYLK